MARWVDDAERRDWCAGRMAIYDDWDGIAHARGESWARAVQQHQLEAQLACPRPAWQRHVGMSLMRVGSWLMRLGAAMTGKEGPPRVSVAG